jgi:arabinosaccharide transport system substrate-binding protein
MWVFARPHHDLYVPNIEEWNRNNTPSVHLYLLSVPALERRMTSGFLSDTPVADLIEADVNVASRAFTGPIEDVGFVNLTERLRAEGLYEEFNAPSFSPWTSRGEVFGIPHDVHPIMLVYRADLVEEAGIDVDEIETWDDFIREFRPLMDDRDGDGRPDRYLLNVWETQIDVIEALILQAGGRYFDENEQPAIDTELNAHVISTLVTWLTGPERIAVDAEEFRASGNRLKIEGFVVASLMPDWLGGVWKKDMPQLHGKLKLMPVPAWKPGGRRTSVWGGTMLGVTKNTSDFDTAWTVAKQLYLSRDIAEQLYETNGIISPLKKYWSEDFYRRPDPYFRGQSPGEMYIKMAPDVPPRTSSPFNKMAKERVRDVIVSLRRYAEENEIYEIPNLLEEARRQLEAAEAFMRRKIERNVFLSEPAGEEGS